MGFLDQLGDLAKNIGDKANEVAKNVGEKASDALEISKLNSKIAAEKLAIDGEMKKISEQVFKNFTDGKEIPEEFKAFCEKIKSHFGEIDNIKAEIEKIKTAAGEKVEEVKDAVVEKAEDVKDAVEEKVEEAKDAAEDKVEEVKDKVEEIL